MSWLPLLLAPPSRRGVKSPVARAALLAVDWALLWLSLILNTVFLYSDLEELGPLLCSVGLLAVALIALWVKRPWLRWGAWGLLALAHLLFIYALLSFSLLLGWSTSGAERGLVGGLALLALASLALQVRSRSNSGGTFRVDSQPIDSQPLDSQPTDSQSLDSQSLDSQSTDSQSTEVDHVDSRPGGTHRVGSRVGGSESGGSESGGSEGKAREIRGKTAWLSDFFPAFPLFLPIGLMSTLCLLGWHAEDGVVRCNDYFRAIGQEGVSLVLPSTRELQSCVPGKQLLLQRYPRRTWEDESGERLIITTQPGIRHPTKDFPYVSDALDGSICEAKVGEVPHHCIASGKAQPILDVGDPERLFVLSWGHLEESGGKGRVFRVPKYEPLELLDETVISGSFGEGFYDSKSDMFYLFADECAEALPLHYATREFGAPIPLPLCPGETRYSQEQQKGVFCSGSGPMMFIDGQSYLGIGFRGEPFETWLLGPSGRYPYALLSMTWGCDIDYQSETVFVASASLGRLFRIDFESGTVRDSFWIPMGVRNVLYDPARDWLFLTDFLRGSLLAVDAKTGEHRGRWFVGRFLRGAEHTREGNGVLVTSNLGVIRVTPPPP